jgi:hypothetical protein
VPSNTRQRAVIYPDSDDEVSSGSLANGSDGNYDRIEKTYYANGALETRKDQRGVELTHEHDDAGRRTKQWVSSGSPAGDQQINYSYSDRGQLATVKTFASTSSGTGSTITSVVTRSYDGFGQLSQSDQDHKPSGGYNAGVPSVTYSRAAANGNRLDSMTYPSGRTLDYTYGSGGSIPDHTNRVAAIENSGNTTTYAGYARFGSGRIAEVDYPQPSVRFSHHHSDADSDYEALDRFGRVVDHRWRDTAAASNLVQHQHDYDRASNRLNRRNTQTTGEDRLYSYDDIHRLIDAQRGDLNIAGDSINTLSAQQKWTLEALGNWQDFDEDTDGDGTFDLDQSRSHNLANEITDITETAGPAWATPGHDKAGNMTTIPQPADPANSYTASYDAWHRLIRVVDDSTSNTLMEAAYDGLNRRISKDLDTNNDGTMDQTRHFYYSSDWQVLEIREAATVGGEGQLQRQYVHGERYVDAHIARFRDTTGDGSSDETRYLLQDANFDVVATVDTSGTVQERFRFTAYGKRTVLDANFSADSDGLSDDEVRIGSQGLAHDAATGLIVNNERYRHPVLGRYTTADPINTPLVSPLTQAMRQQQRSRSRDGGMGRYADSMNLYQMLGSNPVNRLDPTGLEWVDSKIDFCGFVPSIHGYIKLPSGTGYGFYAESHIRGDPTKWEDMEAGGLTSGWVYNRDHIVYEQLDCKSIMVNDCACDPKKFRKEVKKWVKLQYLKHGWNRQSSWPRIYNAAGVGGWTGAAQGDNCYTWRKRAIQAGLKACEKDGVTAKLSGLWTGLWKLKEPAPPPQPDVNYTPGGAGFPSEPR